MRGIEKVNVFLIVASDFLSELTTGVVVHVVGCHDSIIDESIRPLLIPRKCAYRSQVMQPGLENVFPDGQWLSASREPTFGTSRP